MDVYRMTADGAAALTEDEIEAVRVRVQKWEELEDEVMDRLPGELRLGPDPLQLVQPEALLTSRR